MADCIRYSEDSLLLDVQAQPGASKSELVTVKNQRLKVRIAAAPEDGRANRELIALFSRLLHCPKGKISVKLGEKSRQKTLELPKSYGEALEALLDNLQ